MIRVMWKETDVSRLMTLVTVEQTLTGAGKEARLQGIYAPDRPAFALLNPLCGDPVTVEAKGVLLFSGSVERVEWDSEGLLLTLICFEPSALLAKNEAYRAFSGSPKEVAAQLCRLCGLPLHRGWDKPGRVFLPPARGYSLLQLLRQAYGNDCVLHWQPEGLTIAQAGKEAFLLPEDGILSLSAAHDCQRTVTGAAVISAKGKTLATAALPELETRLGPRRRVYALVGAQAQANAQAQSCLTAPDYTGTLLLDGHPEAKCGLRMEARLGAWGLQGTYLLHRVLHRLEGGIFTTTIGVMRL